MICFEVRLNGQLLCTAGVGNAGVLNTILAWVKRQPEACLDDEIKEEWCKEELDLSVGGITNNGSKSEHLQWLSRRLKAGDEVLVKVVERTGCDLPVTRKERTSCGAGVLTAERS